MIVQRHVYQVKPGNTAPLTQRMREEDDVVLATGKVSRAPARIYTAIFGSQYRVAIEWTNASREEQEAGWEAFIASGRAAAFGEFWNRLAYRYETNEIFDVVAAHTVEGEENTIAVRWICDALPGKADEVADLWQRWVIDPQAYTARLLRPGSGAMPYVILEVEYADLADYQARMRAWSTQDGIDAFWQAFDQTVRPGGTTEVWQLMP